MGASKIGLPILLLVVYTNLLVVYVKFQFVFPRCFGKETRLPERVFYWRGASYSLGLGGGQEFTIWDGSVDAGWGGSVGEHDK